MRLLDYDIDQLTNNQQVFAKKCNGIIFKNGGDVDATINGIPLPAGETIDDFAKNHPGDVVVNTFSLNFKPGTLGTNPLVSVIRIITTEVPKSEECNYIRNNGK